MKAIQFTATIPRYALGMVLGKITPTFLWNGVSCTSEHHVPEPRLPNDEWVKVKTRYGGICGSDLGSIHLHVSPYYSALNSFPLTFGHENVGTIAEVGARAGDWRVGERVVAEPVLWCKPRGVPDLCRFCARGEINLCERMTQGNVSPGVMIGSCRDTGGSWSEYFIAHSSQLYRVPDTVSDENALLVEPFAVGLHAALQGNPHDHEMVVIVGAGIISLLTLAALRQIGSRANIIVLARYPFQADAARRLGASDVIVGRGDSVSEIARRTGGQLHKPIIGKRVMEGGGADMTFEGVGTDSSLDTALRLTRHGGRVVLVGLPGIGQAMDWTGLLALVGLPRFVQRVDWTAAFAKELQVQASSFYNHAEPYGGEKQNAFALTLDWMARGELDLSWLVTHKFKLDEYGRAFELLGKRGASKVIKAVFEF